MLEVEVVLPVDGIGLTHKPKEGIDECEDQHSSFDEQARVEIVEFIVKMRHLVGVLL